MAESRFFVEYQNLLLKAGESMPLPKEKGALHIKPAKGCHASIRVGEIETSIDEQEITVFGDTGLTVLSGILVGGMVYEAILTF